MAGKRSEASEEIAGRQRLLDTVEAVRKLVEEFRPEITGVIAERNELRAERAELERRVERLEEVVSGLDDARRA